MRLPAVLVRPERSGSRTSNDLVLFKCSSAFVGKCPRFRLCFRLDEIIAGLMRDQQRLIEYLREGNRVLRQQFGMKRLRPSDDQRRMLAVNSKVRGHTAMDELATSLSQSTMLRWHRAHIARKYTGCGRRRDRRLRVMADLRNLVVRVAHRE